MKKISIGLLVVMAFFALNVQNGYALWGKKSKDEPQKPKAVKESAAVEKKEVKEETKEVKQEVKKEEPKAPVVKELSPKELADKEKMKELREKKRSQLNNTLWNIEVSPIAGGEKKTKDVLRFENNRFSSEKYSKAGFNPTNYTLTLKEEDVTVFETMQTGEKGEIIFWRGEVTSDLQKIRGVLSHQKEPGKSEDFSFVSVSREAIK